MRRKSFGHLLAAWEIETLTRETVVLTMRTFFRLVFLLIPIDFLCFLNGSQLLSLFHFNQLLSETSDE